MAIGKKTHIGKQTNCFTIHAIIALRTVSITDRVGENIAAQDIDLFQKRQEEK